MQATKSAMSAKTPPRWEIVMDEFFHMRRDPYASIESTGGASGEKSTK